MEGSFKEKYVKVGSGWKNPNSTSIKLDTGIKLVLIQNLGKRGLTHPDYIIYARKEDEVI